MALNTFLNALMSPPRRRGVMLDRAACERGDSDTSALIDTGGAVQPCGLTNPLAAAPLALYIHFPWCVKKCPYCDFNSHPLRGRLETRHYLDALTADFRHDAAKLDGRPIQSIFLGGGTPSLFSGAEIGRLLRHIADHAELAPDLEITLEANPGALEADAFAAYLEAGVNRLSLGVQSFNDRSLAALGRTHSAGEAGAAIRSAADAGFTNINLDLMFALPGQHLRAALADCEAALAFAPAHLSCYQLTIEPNTLFHRRPPDCPEADLQHAMQEAVAARLAAAGYARYEVSAYCRPGKQCRHNVNYWQFGDYLGIGAGAHAKWSVNGPHGRAVAAALQHRADDGGELLLLLGTCEVHQAPAGRLSAIRPRWYDASPHDPTSARTRRSSSPSPSS